MEHIKVELLTEEHAAELKRSKKKLYRRVKVIFALVLFLVIGSIAFSYNTITSDTSFESSSENGSFFTQVRQFIGLAPKKLPNEESDRINILLLGHGGAGHDGPELTDTIMIASIKPSSKEAALVSIPRDLVVYQGERYGWRKINHINAFGENELPGSGPEKARQIISEAFNIPIQYYIKVDFSGLVQIIDTLGGLDIEIAKSFTDYTYPTADFHTTTIAFEQGMQKLLGEEVLQFVRSRHGTNGEASDFARAARQQLVLESIKNQALSLGLVLQPNKINSYLKTIDRNMVTNLKAWEISRLAGLARDISENEIANLVLSDSPDGLLTSRLTQEGAYILTPRHESFSEISFEIENIFTPDAQRPEPVKVAVQNGTFEIGLASKVARTLENKKYYVSQIANATRKDWDITTIYKLSSKVSSDDLNELAKEMSANISLGLPSWLVVTDRPTSTTTPSIPPSDLLIIIGANAVR
jgi:polyisoprenyl-teichoic acid--peptidoglycan teichoic acid transferase